MPDPTRVKDQPSERERELAEVRSVANSWPPGDIASAHDLRALARAVLRLEERTDHLAEHQSAINEAAQIDFDDIRARLDELGRQRTAQTLSKERVVVEWPITKTVTATCICGRDLSVTLHAGAPVIPDTPSGADETRDREQAEGVRRFRKKPVVIEAMQYGPATCEALHRWLGYEHRPARGEPCGKGEFLLGTLEGGMTVRPGDYVIRGVKGDFYSCKSDIFADTYENVPPEQHPESSAPVAQQERDRRREILEDFASLIDRGVTVSFNLTPHKERAVLLAALRSSEPVEQEPVAWADEADLRRMKEDMVQHGGIIIGYKEGSYTVPLVRAPLEPREGQQIPWRGNEQVRMARRNG